MARWIDNSAIRVAHVAIGDEIQETTTLPAYIAVNQSDISPGSIDWPSDEGLGG
jgi:hypothetical protein